MKDDTLVKAAGGMTAGIGGQKDTCGALIGACLMLGAACGRGRDDENPEKLGASIMQAGRFYDWFKERNSFTTCRDILTKHGDGVLYDIHNPDEVEQAKKAFARCDVMVQEAAAKAAEMIIEGPPPPPPPPEEK